MGKPIDWDAINELDLDTSPEAEVRFNAALKRAMNVPISEVEAEALRKWTT